jgi:hypothetical protein
MNLKYNIILDQRQPDDCLSNQQVTIKFLVEIHQSWNSNILGFEFCDNRTLLVVLAAFQPLIIEYWANGSHWFEFLINGKIPLLNKKDDWKNIKLSCLEYLDIFVWMQIMLGFWIIIAFFDIYVFNSLCLYQMIGYIQIIFRSK